MILISACLAGENVKYSGGNNAVLLLCQWIEKHRDNVLLVCPELMGGLPVPRLPAEIQRHGTNPEDCCVVNKVGEDVTAQLRFFHDLRWNFYRKKNCRTGHHGFAANGKRGQGDFGERCFF